MYEIFMKLYFRIGEGESLDYITVESCGLKSEELTPEALDALAAEALTATAEQEGCSVDALTPVDAAEVEQFEFKLRLKAMREHGGLLGALLGGLGGFGEDEDEDEDDDEDDPFLS